MEIAYFRAMSYIINDSEEQRLAMHHVITIHILSIPELITGLGANGSLEYYNQMLNTTLGSLEWLKVECGIMWGTDFEMSVLAHLLLTKYNNMANSTLLPLS